MVINFTKLIKIIKYLSNYKLKTKKKISYNTWLKIYNIVKNKKHLTLSGLNKIKKLKLKLKLNK
jgi:hypothetical protein